MASQVLVCPKYGNSINEDIEMDVRATRRDGIRMKLFGTRWGGLCGGQDGRGEVEMVRV